MPEKWDHFKSDLLRQEEEAVVLTDMDPLSIKGGDF